MAKAGSRPLTIDNICNNTYSAAKVSPPNAIETKLTMVSRINFNGTA